MRDAVPLYRSNTGKVFRMLEVEALTLAFSGESEINDAFLVTFRADPDQDPFFATRRFIERCKVKVGDWLAVDNDGKPWRCSDSRVWVSREKFAMCFLPEQASMGEVQLALIARQAHLAVNE